MTRRYTYPMPLDSFPADSVSEYQRGWDEAKEESAKIIANYEAVLVQIKNIADNTKASSHEDWLSISELAAIPEEDVKAVFKHLRKGFSE